MSKTVCRKCPNCGLYHDMTLEQCQCGTEISFVKQEVLEKNTIPLEQQGKIDDSLTIYMQRCSECGSENFTTDIKKRVQRCWNCSKARVRSVDPVLYFENQPAETLKTAPLSEKSPAEHMEPPNFDNQPQTSPNVTQAASLPPKPSWGNVLRKLKSSRLVMTSVRYGRHSFSVLSAAGAVPIMLGRDAFQKDFLQQDKRVGNRHCEIYFKDGTWYVKDNASQNGTFVNGSYIGENGVEQLKDGDLLKLGHNDDSMEFRVSVINE